MEIDYKNNTNFLKSQDKITKNKKALPKGKAQTIGK